MLRISLSISDASLTVVDKRITLEWRQQARPPLSCRSRQHPHKANLSFRESAWGRSNLRPHDLSYQGVPVRIRSSARYAGSALRRNSRLSLPLRRAPKKVGITCRTRVAKGSSCPWKRRTKLTNRSVAASHLVTLQSCSLDRQHRLICRVGDIILINLNKVTAEADSSRKGCIHGVVRPEKRAVPVGGSIA